MKKALALLLSVILTFSCFGLLGTGSALAEETNTSVIMQSDFNDADGTNWQANNGLTTAYLDDDADGVNDTVRITHPGNGQGGSTLSYNSTAFNLIPGNDYELSFYLRIPEESPSWIVSNLPFSPAVAIYETTADTDGKATTILTKTTSASTNNYYAYKDIRRTNLSTVWSVEGVEKTYTRTVYSNFTYSEHKSLVATDAKEYYSDWKKVTAKFTAIADEDGETSQTVAVAFSFNPLGSSSSGGFIFDLKDVQVKETVNITENVTETVIMESDFSTDTKWQAYQIGKTDLDEDGDGTTDSVRLTHDGTSNGSKLQYISEPFELIPGNEYELSYYLRVPEESTSYIFSDTPYSPAVTLYETGTGSTGKANAFYKLGAEAENNNLYASGAIRRTAFSAVWSIEGVEGTYTRNSYSNLTYSQHKDIVTTDAKEFYSDWKKVTAKFTAIADEEGETSQTVALAFSFHGLTAIENLMFDLKDVKIVEKAAEEEEEIVVPEGALFYESFEDVTTDDGIREIMDVPLYTSANSFARPKLCTSDAASGSKSLTAHAMFQSLYVPLDKSLLTEDTFYDFSMNWKMLAYSETTKHYLRAFELVAWNSENGDTFTERTRLSKMSSSSVTATGDWQNTFLRFKWLSGFADKYDNVGIRIDYYAAKNSEGKYTSDNNIFIDDLLLKETDAEALAPITLDESARTEDTIKVLAFGNSFSVDVTAFIQEIAEADGTDIRVGNAWIGGCSLQNHFSNRVSQYYNYTFQYHNPIDGYVELLNLNMEQILNATDWDYISLQQVSGSSGKIDTFEPYLNDLIEYFKEVCPDAKIVLHSTWAYSQDSTHADFAEYDSDQTTMYEAIKDTYLQVSENYGYLRIIPSGEAIQRVRATSMGDNFTRDGFHLNDKGRIIAGLTWYETFTGISALDTKFDLTTAIGTVGDTMDVNVGITAEEDVIMRTAAHEAVALYKKANEAQLAIDGMGEITDDSYETILKLDTMREELGDDTFLTNLDELVAAIDTYKSLCVGDVVNDGALNLKDLVTLARLVADWDGLEYDKYALDIDGNDVTELNDVNVFAQYLAGWDVELAK